MTSRSDGTNTTTYAWNEDNRLTLVTLPSSATVAYTYDAMARMLTRTDSTGTTYFTWDGWNLASELAPNGTQTRYYAPNGELLYFEQETATTDRPAEYGSAYYGQNYYGALIYQVVRDGLGSVRRIVDSYNNIVSTIDTDAFGKLLPSTSDPLGFSYYYVGAYGVRWEAGPGLYYVRQRWYDPVLARFLSREVRGGTAPYQYCNNNPSRYVDVSGFYSIDPKLIDIFGQDTFDRAFSLINDQLANIGPCKGNYYNFNAEQMRCLAGNILSILKEPRTEINLSPDTNDADTLYGSHSAGGDFELTQYLKTTMGNLSLAPGLSGIEQRIPDEGERNAYLLAHVLIHEILHEYVDRTNPKYGKLPKVKKTCGVVANPYDMGGHEGHEFIVDILGCLFPKTKGWTGVGTETMENQG